MDAAAAKFVADNTKEYVSHGGRVGLYGGGEAGIKSLEAGAPDITYEGNEGPQAPMKMADMEQIAIDFKREHGWDMSLASPETTPRLNVRSPHTYLIPAFVALPST